MKHTLVSAMRYLHSAIALCCLPSIVAMADDSRELVLVESRRIWDRAPHNAFTDLIRFQDRWYCVFREGKGHAGDNGKVRVIVAADGVEWESAALIAQDGIDLRDPKLSVTPDGRLMLVAGGSVYRKGKYLTRAPRVAFSKDGRTWSTPQKVLAEDHWLWRVTWQGKWGWSVSKLGEGRDPRRGMLYRTKDGIDWEWITEFRLPNNTWNASETTLRFLPDGEMIALTRPHWIGTSKPPYKSLRRI